MPTQPQLKRLFALARKAGISPDEVKGIVQERYGHASRRDLTDREYEDLTAYLQELTGDRAADSGRQAPGELANQMEILAWIQVEKLPWNEILLTEMDYTLAATVLDDFRRYRTRYKRISVRDARTWLGWWRGHSLSTWRRACEIWLAQYRTKNERYFAGILRHVDRDAARAPAA